MNTTMAPMDQLRQDTLEELRRRDDLRHAASLRRRDGGNGAGGKGGEGKRGDGNGDDNGGGGGGGGGNSGNGGGGGGNGNGNGGGPDSNGNGGDGKNNNNNEKNGGGSDNQKHNSSPPAAANEPSPPPTIVSTTPTTVVLISTTTAPAIAATSSSNTLVSTFFPITPSTTPFPTLSASAFSNPPDSSSQPRKGLSDDPDFPPSRIPKTITATTTSSMFLVPESALASSTSSANPSGINNNDNNNHHPSSKAKHGPGDLSPLAQHLLIAAGAIGAFIIVVAGIYFLTRVRKIDLLAFFRNRKFGKGGARGWYGWRKEETDYMSEPPPKYSGEVYPPEKTIPAQQQFDAFYTPTAMPPMANPASSANALARSDSGRQDIVREALLDNPAPFGTSPAPQPAALSATENFYGVAAQPTPLSRQPGTQNSQSTFVSQPSSNYNNTGTQNTFLTMNTMRTVQTQDAYDPNQREPNHLSYLSSLSSGFGDGLIIPESTVVGGGRQSYRQSKAPGAGRFSWMTSNRGSRAPAYGDRDTVYTTASIESAPRFRTVNSWVAQQAGRVERQQDVPAMPSIPAPLIPAPLQIGVGVDHQRKASEDPAFRQHPGEEIEISRGSRVPSSILDRKVGGVN
ncbi:uncharacterized protein LY89DRAFT_768394 [Mollisia scopiformis]|uniref:Uncharacterized protein n=1 Tax=Mollisia scopiformis TaxID=149040 RepID=A0A194XPI6_MOLSC|nr:uncharacterized protein LY89DRAFT_768394 [Mollisia scopiformis]KUJ22103.1 hypothetical protein LY89DRAFT_768394 [Mollisia scopiformis]